MHYPTPHHPRKPTFLSALGLSFILLLTSCVEPVARYQEARVAFSEAAKFGNVSKTSLPANVTPEQAGSVTVGLNSSDMQAEAGYQSALAILQSIDATGEGKLAENGLLADKLTLQALCLWRLSKDSEFQDLIARAETASAKEVGKGERSRDSYILEALPGLMMNDQAYRRIPKSDDPSPNTTELSGLVQLLAGPDESALHYISKAREAAEKNNHPVQDYLVTAELAAYRNLQKSYYIFGSAGNSFGKTEEHTTLLKLLKKLKDSDRKESNAIRAMWGKNFGLQ